ncbi:MAG: branched-chain amino acid transport system substrate-binding protein [Halobacteriales archaeon]|jgi:branched-chain amino acid transport system substrate-binding protein
MNTRRAFLKATGTASVVAVAGCADITGGGDEGPIKIGFNAPLTGFASADGQSAQQGAKLARDLINDEGGVDGREIRLLVEDDAAASDQAVPVAKDFINNENVHFGVSGSYSTPTRAISTIYNNNDVPFISAYATHPDITNGKYTFRVGIFAPIHGKAAAKIAAEEMDVKTAAVFKMNNDFGKTISNQFAQSAKERGIDIVYSTTYPLGETNFRSALNSVKDEGPDLLHATGYYHEAANVVKQAKEVGVEAPIFGEEGYDSPKFFELGGQACNGTMITTNLNRGGELDATQTFLEEYRNKYDMRADMVAANSYDAIKLAAKAVKEGGSTDADTVAETINGLTDWKGAATGPIREFIGPGESVRPIPVQEVKNMEWTEYSVITDEEIIRPDV